MDDTEDTLERAIAAVREERTLVRAECEMFEAFREAIRLTQPDRGRPDDAASTASLLERYRETVMATPDYEATYGESLEESLRNELPPGVAKSLIAGDPFTHRFKTRLLVATSRAICRREQFVEELDTELASLREIADELRGVDAEVASLSPCSLDTQTVEEFIDTWESYGELVRRCERLSDRRQRLIGDAVRVSHPAQRHHELNEYLYEDLDTEYPGLSAIALTISRINVRRGGARRPLP